MSKILCIIILMLSLASCKKEYLCTCTVEDLDKDDYRYMFGKVVESVGKHKNQAAAQKACDAYDESDAYFAYSCAAEVN